VSGPALSESEEAELFVLLKPREGALSGPLVQLLRRLEKSLYERMTVEEIEALCARFAQER
jgi:hypothetical protein